MFFKVKIALLSMLLLMACSQDKMPLPSPAVESFSFGANDTSYVELYPVWDQSTLGYAFSEPADISMGLDGLIFVADKGNDRVVVLTKAGAMVTRDGLGGITGIPAPTGVTIDSKLNVLVVNGSNEIFCWNQYLNYAELDSIADSAVFFDPAKNDTVHLSLEQYIQMAISEEEPLPRFRAFLFEKDDAAIAAVEQVYTFYRDSENKAEFNDIAAGEFGSDQLYVTESNNHRIAQIALVPKLAFRNRFGSVVMQYAGVFVKDVVTVGSGAGTADEPQGVVMDGFGNLYFTQLGGNFRVQKLLAESFAPQYVLYQHEIMDLGRFKSPYDLALDDVNNIFVVDAEQQRVFKFFNSGPYAGDLADLGEKGLATATFADPRGIIAAENIVYVLESGQNRIRRFQYSVSDEDLPEVDVEP